MKRFKDKNAEAIFSGKTVKKLPHDVQRRALLRLNRIVTTATLEDLSQPPSHRLKALQGDRKDNTVSASTINIGSVSSGLMAWHGKLKSPTIIESDDH
jgi:plasmid maintenance system killer protein